MEAARHLVRILVEFPARVQLGHDDLGRRDPFALMDVGRNPAAVVGDRARAVGVQRHLDPAGVAGQGLVDRVIDYFMNHVMQARAVIGVADVHAGTLADRVESLEDLDRFRAVFLGVLGRGVVSHSVFHQRQIGCGDLHADPPPPEGLEQRRLGAGEKRLERKRIDLIEQGRASQRVQMSRHFVQQ